MNNRKNRNQNRNQKKGSVAILMMLLLLSVAGCGKKTEEAIPPSAPIEQTQAVESPTETALSTEAGADVISKIADLKTQQVLPKEFIRLAKDNMADVTAEEKLALVRAILESQKHYLPNVGSAYEKANSNQQFSDLYAMDVSKGLAEQITDETIKQQVMSDYENGLTLVKEEGYVYPIIDLEFYRNEFMSQLSDSEATALETEITQFNASL
ncbi:MAG: hypothetical protein RR238_05085 [Lachnospiraceae bacterium]